MLKLQHPLNMKITNFEDLSSKFKHLRNSHRIVQCHGVFDLLHIGHIKHFQSAKKYGDILVITITPDEYVNKGQNRPYFTAKLRAEAIAALDCVDYVVINAWPTAIEAIKLIKPNVYIKGAEYQDIKNDITGKIQDEIEAVRAVGGTIAYTDDITFSSSSLLNKFYSSFSPEVTDYLFEFKKKYNVLRILEYLENAKDLNVLVVGEAIIDIYHFGDVIGKAGKEPTLVAKQKSTETYAGGILALANHLSEFCKKIDCLTYLGENKEYEDWIKVNLKPNITLLPLYKKNSPTIIKRRYLDEYLRQKMFEVYEINDDFLEDDQQQQLLNEMNHIISHYDLVIAADYGHGLINKAMINVLTHKSNFFSVNTQSNASNHGFNCISKYQKADYVAIANRELQLNYRQKHLSTKEQLNQLMNDYAYKNVMITMGKNGLYICKQNEEIIKVPTFATNIVDRVGAGDAVLALSTLTAYFDAPSEITAFIGNIVGAEAVGIMGNKQTMEKIPLMKHIVHLLK